MPDPRTAARTHLADTRPEQDDVTVPTPQRRPLGLSLTQIAGGALAAVTAAVAASFLGVAGTITGAAFGSVVSSIGAAVYSTSLSRAARASRVLVVRPGGLAADDPASVPPPVGHDPEVLADAPADAVTTPADTPPEAHVPVWSRLRWRPVLLVAGTFFVAAMAVIVVTELVIGHPISNSSESGTTISNIGGSSGSSPSSPSPTPAPGASSTSASPSPGASPTGTPSSSSSPAPSQASATGTATSPTAATTTAPSATGSAPAPSTPATTGPAPSPAVP